MNKQVTSKCENTATKIIEIIDALGFTIEKKPKFYELRTLITNEIRHCVSDVATDFYKNVAIVPIEAEDESEDEQANPI